MNNPMTNAFADSAAANSDAGVLNFRSTSQQKGQGGQIAFEVYAELLTNYGRVQKTCSSLMTLNDSLTFQVTEMSSTLDERKDELVVLTKRLENARKAEKDFSKALSSKETTARDAERKAANYRADAEKLRSDVADAILRAENAEREVRALRRSTSWRLTGPMRSLVMFARRLFSRSITS